jgi:hypothetical protein
MHKICHEYPSVEELSTVGFEGLVRDEMINCVRNNYLEILLEPSIPFSVRTYIGNNDYIIDSQRKHAVWVLSKPSALGPRRNSIWHFKESEESREVYETEDWEIRLSSLGEDEVSFYVSSNGSDWYGRDIEL